MTNIEMLLDILDEEELAHYASALKNKRVIGDNSRKAHYAIPDTNTLNPDWLLMYSFEWSNTDEGNDYWKKVWAKVRNEVRKSPDLQLAFSEQVTAEAMDMDSEELDETMREIIDGKE
jgi:hypothetical protein